MNGLALPLLHLVLSSLQNWLITIPTKATSQTKEPKKYRLVCIFLSSSSFSSSPSSSSSSSSPSWELRVRTHPAANSIAVVLWHRGRWICFARFSSLGTWKRKWRCEWRPIRYLDELIVVNSTGSVQLTPSNIQKPRCLSPLLLISINSRTFAVLL